MPATLEQRIKFRNDTLSAFSVIHDGMNIAPIIPLIQSAHESNWGLSQLAANEKNIFGMTPGEQWIKAMRKEIPMDEVMPWSTAGAITAYYPTTEYSHFPPNKIHFWDFGGDIEEKREDGKGGSILIVKRYFRKYLSWEESALDWARKISRDPRYRFAYEAAKTGDVRAYAEAVLKAGYATDADYAEKLVLMSKAVSDLPML